MVAVVAYPDAVGGLAVPGAYTVDGWGGCLVFSSIGVARVVARMYTNDMGTNTETNKTNTLTDSDRACLAKYGEAAVAAAQTWVDAGYTTADARCVIVAIGARKCTDDPAVVAAFVIARDRARSVATRNALYRPTVHMRGQVRAAFIEQLEAETADAERRMREAADVLGIPVVSHRPPEPADRRPSGAVLFSAPSKDGRTTDVWWDDGSPHVCRATLRPAWLAERGGRGELVLAARRSEPVGCTSVNQYGRAMSGQYATAIESPVATVWQESDRQEFNAETTWHLTSIAYSAPTLEEGLADLRRAVAIDPAWLTGSPWYTGVPEVHLRHADA